MRRMLESSTAFKLPSGFHKERVQWLYDGSAAKDRTAPKHLLYWMQTSVRAKYNYSLEYAIAAANALALPLRVVYFLADRSVVPEAARESDPNAYGFATERHAKFGLEGLQAVHKRLQQRGLSFDVLHHRHTSDNASTRSELLHACARDAALVVTDRPYLRPWREALDACAADAAAEAQPWGLVQVESDIVVPCETASDKEEYAARTIRPKITRHLSTFLVPLDHAEVSAAARSAPDTSATTASSSPSAWLSALIADSSDDPAASSAPELVPLDVASLDVDTLLETLDLDRSVRGVSAFIGGESVAVDLAKTFLEHKLCKYADDRNEPSGDGGSNLSLYLRFGHISPVRIALAAKKVTSASAKAGRESFLEELIVRRELAINMAVFNVRAYDSIQCLPTYAATTLADHAGDTRAHVYSLAQLEAAQSYDVYWNAAQLEMVTTGKMHGYMRMYWGKKILEWTESPETAYAIALQLNNKYALDAPDPNSYTGIAWTFGKHDQGWKERPVFGKVRYMNEAGLKRKFRMDAYVRKVQAFAKAYGAGTVSGSGTTATVTTKRKTLESFWSDATENGAAAKSKATAKAKATTTKATATKKVKTTK